MVAVDRALSVQLQSGTSFFFLSLYLDRLECPQRPCSTYRKHSPLQGLEVPHSSCVYQSPEFLGTYLQFYIRVHVFEHKIHFGTRFIVTKSCIKFSDCWLLRIHFPACVSDTGQWRCQLQLWKCYSVLRKAEAKWKVHWAIHSSERRVQSQEYAGD